MIVVTGAAGELGRRIVEGLLARMPAERVGVSVRDPQAVPELAARGVRVRHGDFGQPETLAHAFEGAEQVLVVSVDSFGDSARAQHRAAVDAAVAKGAQRVLYTSHMGAARDSLFGPPMFDHAETEAVLEASGIAFTSLRNGFYASTVPRLLGDALQTGRLVAPADGPVSWTTHADLAEVAAVALAEPGRLDGLTPPLTAAEAVDFAGIAALLSELSGRTIERVVVEDDAWVDQLVAGGVPREPAQLLLGLFRASRRGEFAAVDPTLGELLGRKPQTLRDVLAPAVLAANAAG